MSSESALLETGTLWRVVGTYRGQIVTPGSKYYLVNKDRAPAGLLGFQYTVSGVVQYRDRTGTYPVPSGHAFLHEMGDDVTYFLPTDAPENYVCDWITFMGAGLPEHWRVLRKGHGSVVPVDRPMLQAMWNLIELASPKAALDPTVIADAVHDFLMSLFLKFRQQKLQLQNPVDAAVDDVLRHPSYPWSLKELAEKYGCSREHLTRVFKERVGTSPGAWLNQSRLRKAMDLLASTDMPVASVAERAGFASAHTLARHLRRVTGKSPRALRHSPR
jgi:AraC-like DNA-binding protein